MDVGFLFDHIWEINRIMTSSVSRIESNIAVENNCSSATYSSLLSDIIVCLDMDAKCLHAMHCGSTCYCANHAFYQYI